MSSGSCRGERRGSCIGGDRKGIVTLSDYKLFSACLHEAKPLTLRREAIGYLPKFGVNPVNVKKPARQRRDV